MPKAVGIRFKRAGKIYYFDPTGLENLAVDDYVVVETSQGKEAGRVVIAPRELPDEQVPGPLKPIQRSAEARDLILMQRYRYLESKALERCRQKVAEYGLPMKMLQAEYNFDGSHLTFYFTAEKRVDFRELLRDLARMFRSRIELRQVGVRDEAKLLGGVGRCGRPLCCTTFLCEFSPVSIRMAKEQDLPLSPMEISGACGRLLCCLAYENEYYREVKSRMPRVGERVITPFGTGQVTGINVPKETLSVELDSQAIIEVRATEVGQEGPERGQDEQSRRRRTRRRRKGGAQ